MSTNLGVKIPEPLSTRPLIAPETSLPDTTANQNPNQPLEIKGDAGRIIRYWSPQFLNLVNVPAKILGAPDGYGARGFLSNIIDMSGMTCFTVQAMKTVSIIEGGVPNYTFMLESAFNPMGSPVTFDQPIFTTKNNAGGAVLSSCMFIDTFTMPDVVGTWSVVRGKQLGTERGAGSGGGSGLFGPLLKNCRIFIDSNVATANANQLWSVCAWATNF